MEWINLHSSTMRHPGILLATAADRGTWIMLLAYCTQCENSGRITGCNTWTDRQWIATVGCTLAEVMTESSLWSWKGQDLVVEFYPEARETEIKRKRLGGQMTVEKRWSRHRSPVAPQVAPSVAPQVAPQVAPSVAPRYGKEGNGRGKEWNGKEPPGGPPAPPIGQVNSPTLEQVTSYFSKIGADYSSDEVRLVWLSFEADKDLDGRWHFGRRPVGDWRAAMERRMADLRMKTNAAAPDRPANHPAKPLTPAEASMFTAQVDSIIQATKAGRTLPS